MRGLGGCEEGCGGWAGARRAAGEAEGEACRSSLPQRSVSAPTPSYPAKTSASLSRTTAWSRYTSDMTMSIASCVGLGLGLGSGLGLEDGRVLLRGRVRARVRMRVRW